MIYITAVQMSQGGTSHEHIENVQWHSSADGITKESSVPNMVTFIEGGGRVAVQGPPEAAVGVWESSSGRKYIRTYSDGTWTNNLLSLPRY